MYTVTRTDEYLSHHGILGQRWGVRRYQNKDGSLTSNGKKRYSKSRNKSDETEKNKQGLSDNQKKAIKIGAAVTATALATYGGYKLSKYIKTEAGSRALKAGQSVFNSMTKKADSVFEQNMNLALDRKLSGDSVKYRELKKAANRIKKRSYEDAKLTKQFYEKQALDASKNIIKAARVYRNNSRFK